MTARPSLENRIPTSQIARNLNIAVSTAHRTYHCFEDVSAVSKKPYHTAQRKMGFQEELFVI